MNVDPKHPSSIRILVADDHLVVRAGLRSLLRRQPDMIVVGEAANATDLLGVARDTDPDVVILDLRMPGGGVLDCIRSLAARRGPRVVVFTAYDDPMDASLALRAGASGYVLKQAPEEHLLTAVRRAHTGRPFVEEPVAARIAQDEVAPTLLDRAARLSARETAVLGLVARGYTGRQIATELGLRLGTVETYRHRLRKKLGLRSRADVMAFAQSSARLREPP